MKLELPIGISPFADIATRRFARKESP